MICNLCKKEIESEPVEMVFITPDMLEWVTTVPTYVCIPCKDKIIKEWEIKINGRTDDNGSKE